MASLHVLVSVALRNMTKCCERSGGEITDGTDEGGVLVFKHSVTGRCGLTADVVSSWHHAPEDTIDLIM